MGGLNGWRLRNGGDQKKKKRIALRLGEKAHKASVFCLDFQQTTRVDIHSYGGPRIQVVPIITDLTNSRGTN